MKAIEQYLEANRSRIRAWLRAAAGRDGPADAATLVGALAEGLAESGLQVQAVARPTRPVVAVTGSMRRRRVLLLVHGDDGDAAGEPGGARALLVALLAALAALRAADQTPPLGVLLVCEQDRPLGSPSLSSLSLPAADYCLWDGGGYAGDAPWLALGSHGLIRLRLRAIGPGSSAGLGALAVNPAWRLVWALAAIKGRNEAVDIPRFYDPVREAQALEIAALEANAPDLAAAVARGGGAPLLGLRGEHLPLVQAFSPAVNLLTLGVEAAPGRLPAAAWADLALTLVPAQTPEAVVPALQERLAASGLGDVGVAVESAYTGLETAPDAPLVAAAVEEVAARLGVAPALLPFAEEPAPLACLAWRGRPAALGLGVGRGPWPAVEQRVHALAGVLAGLLQRLPSLRTE